MTEAESIQAKTSQSSVVGSKEKIIHVAHELFAQKGFQKTSVRDIAAGAQVNVAMINYYFDSKDQLFWDVYFYSREVLRSKIAEVASEKKDFEESMIAIFQFLVHESDLLRNSFLLIISNSNPPMTDQVLNRIDPNEFGPPGGEFLMRLLSQEVPTSVTQKEKEWMIQTLMMDALMWAMMMSSSICGTIMKMRDELDLEKRTAAMRLHVRALKAQLLAPSGAG